VRIILSGGLLGAEFVIALNNDGAKLKGVLVRRLHVDKESRTAAVIDARLVI